MSPSVPPKRKPLWPWWEIQLIAASLALAVVTLLAIPANIFWQHLGWPGRSAIVIVIALCALVIWVITDRAFRRSNYTSEMFHREHEECVARVSARLSELRQRSH